MGSTEAEQCNPTLKHQRHQAAVNQIHEVAELNGCRGPLSPPNAQLLGSVEDILRENAEGRNRCSEPEVQPPP
jgi:hypothetical protein